MTKSVTSFKKAALFFLCFTLSSTSVANNNEAPTSIKQSCQKIQTYDLYFLGNKSGEFKRQVHIKDSENIRITSSGKAILVFMPASLIKTSIVQWSKDHNSFVTLRTDEEVKGILGETRQMQFIKPYKTVNIQQNKKAFTLKSDHHIILDYDALIEQMRFDLMHGKTTMSYQMVSKTRLRLYEFMLAGEAQINTPYFGTVKALHVKQINRTDRDMNLWIAPSLDYQLVKGSYKKGAIDISGDLKAMTSDCH